MKAAACALVLMLSLGGCGFRPLYAESVGVASTLSAVAVETPSTRTGHLLREELEDQLAASRGADPRYRLRVNLRERRFARGLRIDDTANRYEQRLTATYQLTDTSTGRLIRRATRVVSITYAVADAPYAGVIASQDGQSRAASEMARVIRTDLAQLFIAPPAAPTLTRQVGGR